VNLHPKSSGKMKGGGWWIWRIKRLHPSSISTHEWNQQFWLDTLSTTNRLVTTCLDVLLTLRMMSDYHSRWTM
jgi:hypothetical protein